jgi:hypothetical protein
MQIGLQEIPAEKNPGGNDEPVAGTIPARSNPPGKFPGKILRENFTINP